MLDACRMHVCRRLGFHWLGERDGVDDFTDLHACIYLEITDLAKFQLYLPLVSFDGDKYLRVANELQWVTRSNALHVAVARCSCLLHVTDLRSK